MSVSVTVAANATYRVGDDVYGPGDTLDVTPRTADRLRFAGIFEPLPAPPPPEPNPQPLSKAAFRTVLPDATTFDAGEEITVLVDDEVTRQRSTGGHWVEVIGERGRLVGDLLLGFGPTDEVRFRLSTSDASAFTARFPDGSSATVASDAVHVQSLPAGTHGSVVIDFTGDATRTSLSLIGAPWRSVDGAAIFSPVGAPYVSAYFDIDESAFLTLADDRIVEMADVNGSALVAAQSDPTLRPHYSASDARANALPSWASAGAKVGLDVGSLDLAHLFVGAAYADGTVGVTDNDKYLLSGPTGAGGGQRLVLGNGTGTWFVGSTSLADVARINGAAASDTALPLPLSTLTFTADVPVTQTCFLGYNPQVGSDTRVWEGPLRRFLFTDASMPATERSRIEGWSASRDGVILDPAHPFSGQVPLA